MNLRRKHIMELLQLLTEVIAELKRRAVIRSKKERRKVQPRFIGVWH